MERFVFVAAVTIAIIIGVVAAFGGHWGPHFSFNIDDVDARGTSPVVAVSPGRMASQTYAGTELKLNDLVARVVITPEDRTDFAIDIDNSGGRVPMPVVRVEGNRVIVDGQLRNRIGNCRTDGADLRGYENVSGDQMPLITIHAPRALNIDRSGAGTTEIAASQSLDLDFSGCGTANIADVAGDLSLDVAGSGVLRAGAAHKLNADVSGSGEVSVGAIAEDADVDIAGSGTVTLASLAGDLSADGAGSGNLAVHGGAINEANIDLAGSGDVDIGATVQTLKVSIVGSGDVDVTAAVHDVEADIAGSGSVTVQSVTGTVHKEVYGSGDVTVGH